MTNPVFAGTHHFLPATFNIFSGINHFLPATFNIFSGAHKHYLPESISTYRCLFIIICISGYSPGFGMHTTGTHYINYLVRYWELVLLHSAAAPVK
ncbi:MAG: hypothetical protein FJW56_05355 [Actinobacteria bacterium]|nr:hypothetical protein [Actinomycetota bacterium]